MDAVDATGALSDDAHAQIRAAVADLRPHASGRAESKSALGCPSTRVEGVCPHDDTTAASCPSTRVEDVSTSTARRGIPRFAKFWAPTPDCEEGLCAWLVNDTAVRADSS